MKGDKAARELLMESVKRSFRLSIIIPIVSALTTIITILTGVFVPDTEEGAIHVLITGLSIGSSIILIFYLINWFHCLSFLKESKLLQISDPKLQRLITMNRWC